MALIFLRHPSVSGGEGRCYGRHEMPLGAGAADEIKGALRHTPPAVAVWRSPAGRCIDLAEAIAERDGVTVEVDDRLAELDFGSWEGRSWDVIPRTESDPWAADPVNNAPPLGETFAELMTRVSSVLAAVPDRTALVCHAGPIRAARMLLTGASFTEVFAAPVPHAQPLLLAAPA